MVRGKSKGPGPKKTRLSKKKKQHVLRHTLHHMRGGGDYPQSHQRERHVDPRVAGASILGARLKDPAHQGHTVPRVGKTVSTQTNAARLHSTNRKKSDSASTQTDAVLAKKAISMGAQTDSATRKDAGTQFRPGGVSVGMQVGHEGPRYPKLPDRPAYNANGGGRYPHIGGMGERPAYNPNPYKDEPMLDRPDRMQLDGVHKGKKKGMGPKKMEIERPGRVKKEVARKDAELLGTELVGAADVLHKAPKPAAAPKPTAAPKPAATAAPKPNPFKMGVARDEPKPKERKRENNQRQKEVKREERREGFQRHKRAPRRAATAAEEAAHDQKIIDDSVRNNKSTGELRRQLAQRNRDRKAAREKEAKFAEKRGGIPTGSANIPANQHESGGSGHHKEHHHRHTSEHKMHDLDFRTGL